MPSLRPGERSRDDVTTIVMWQRAGPASGRVTKEFLIAAAGTVLGIITTILNFNWMRTRRRL